MELISKLGWIAFCVVLGLLLTWQAPVNAEAARRLGSPVLAAMLSLGLSVCIIIAFAFFAVEARPSLQQVSGAPWWAWLGGITGAVFVLGGLYVVPHTGNFVFVMSVIAGQMIGALTADRFGMWGLTAVSTSNTKLVAIGIVLAGVLTFHLSD